MIVIWPVMVIVVRTPCDVHGAALALARSRRFAQDIPAHAVGFAITVLRCAGRRTEAGGPT
jgi:hypothetical protein